ncbi:GTPase HflX [Anaeromyxobacter sp. Fw109-5]|uniref:GTPase HflX n=1 Tax=Anaeromyxobacter sp. (strain Fw109-5) TaxID=404589 RepID=UPI0000ED787F|nr:GTPase HflX [Anaeromyxobacter sp. Fw109-5]ABS24436.1 GTP-binding protein HSR1-related [Anaeromyxobacter sp. Fw109-5]
MQDVLGNTLGLKPSQLHALRRTYRRRVDAASIVSPELARHLSEVSRETNRQIGVLLDRKGDVHSVIVGDARKLELPDVGRGRAGESRLRGLRLVHTHLNGEPLTRDDHTDLALLRLDLVAAIEVREDGLPGKVHFAHLVPENAQGAMWKDEAAASVHDLAYDALSGALALEEEFARARAVRRTGGRERAILVGFGGKGRSRADAESSLEELKELARTAGVEVIDATVQLRRDPDPRYLIGKGKLEDVVLRSMQLMATVIVFDAELSPSQARHIAEATSLKILDRTQLILDIFAQRAQSADGKLQVELAQLKYLYPRLVGRDDSLSRLAGGIGGRGPGETKLEIDRRRVRDRITALERRIEALGSSRQLRRKQRNGRGLPVLSIVGYTNAGKSTLLNALTDSAVLAEDKLFATLDPTSRRLRFPRDREVIITDTVGFIRDLPPDLVNAFRATLEELSDADLLLHVVDASDPRHPEQIEAVETILASLGLEQKQRLLVFNKADRLPPGEGAALAHRAEGIAVSALSRDGLAELLHLCDRLLWEDRRVAFADVAASAPPPPATPEPGEEGAARAAATDRAAPEPTPPSPAARLLPSRIARVS